MHHIVTQLGEKVRSEWIRTRCDRVAFPEIAGAVLREITEGIDRKALEKWLVCAKIFPVQLDLHSNFGNPPLTVWYDQELGFAIDLYLWLSNDTSIHDHGFCGACRVIEGDSIHAIYGWTAESSASELRLLESGTLDCVHLERLRPGHIFRIPPGVGLIHRVIHLDHPVLTMTIRTLSEKEMVQRDYFSPGVRIPGHYRSLPAVSKAVRFFDSLIQVDRDSAIEFTREFLRSQNDHIAMGFWMEIIRRNFPFGNDEFEDTLRIVSRRSHVARPALRLLYERIRVSIKLETTFRSSVIEAAKLKEFVGLLIADGFGKPVFDYLSREYDRSPHRVMADWVESMGSIIHPLYDELHLARKIVNGETSVQRLHQRSSRKDDPLKLHCLNGWCELRANSSEGRL